MYLPMVGLPMLVAGQRAGDRSGPARAPATAPWSGPRVQVALAVAVVGVVLALATAAHRYAGKWRDSLTLFEHALAVEPRNHVAHTMLAATHARLGARAVVYAHAEAALRISPASVASASAAISASNAALTDGDVALARRWLERAIARKPRYSEAWNNLGAALRSLGRQDRAVAAFAEALRLEPDNGAARANLARATAGRR